MNPLGPEVFHYFRRELGIETMNELAEKIARLKLPLIPIDNQPMLLQLLSFYKGMLVASIDPVLTKPLQRKLVEWGASQVDPLEVDFIRGAEEDFLPVVKFEGGIRKVAFPFIYKISLEKALELGVSLSRAYVKGGYVYVTHSEVRNVIKKWFEREFEERLRLLQGIDLPEVYHKWYAEVVGDSVPKVELEVSSLDPEAFPPCIRRALMGVPQGYRNFSITLLLTSFLSYARLNLFGKKDKVSSPEELEVLKNEIVPLVLEAGNRCSPPLFEDQPNEIKNVWYVLGFGYTSEPKLGDAGSSKWYFPPNCSKIRETAPFLCPMAEECSNIRNPLVYYLRRVLSKRKARKSSGDGGEGNE